MHIIQDQIYIQPIDKITSYSMNWLQVMEWCLLLKKTHVTLFFEYNSSLVFLKDGSSVGRKHGQVHNSITLHRFKWKSFKSVCV
jgi:hypothetical protein